MINDKKSTNNALKEWAVAINALQDGKTILLMRKGGIREQNNRFEVQHRQILLYPTYEHQKSELLKENYAKQVIPVTSGWHPETVTINSWANITHVLQLKESETLDALLPYHIWNEQFASERYKWKPRQALYLLLLRTYKLALPREIPYLAEYGGCKSWINLAQTISLQGSVPVLGDEEYSRLAAAISNLVPV